MGCLAAFECECPPAPMIVKKNSRSAAIHLRRRKQRVYSVVIKKINAQLHTELT
jgi:hypothetical protein